MSELTAILAGSIQYKPAFLGAVLHPILENAKLCEPGSLGVAATPYFGLEKLPERADVTAGVKVCKALETNWLDVENSDKASPQSCSHLGIYIYRVQ